ncbi:MAG TPA: hypothetical protein VFQ71_12535 [Gaiellales bacterium]|jgi:hypothetical protein|nr:hypothetical protein [Gaiellales bacterium]
MSEHSAVPPGAPAAAEELHRLSWLGPVFLLAGAVLIPWTVYLAITLPSRHVQTHYYDFAWAGFDLALAVLLAVTGVGLLRRRIWVQATATAAATMLLCDAWFDVLSSSGVHDRLVSGVLALVVELPVAAVCLGVARHAEAASERACQYADRARRWRRSES